MKVLVIGSGGREHAIVWKIAQSALVQEIFVAPGNAGIKTIAKCVDISATDIDKLIEFVKENKIDFTIVGPEAPLSLGIVDSFEKEHLKIFGPTALAARLESSKVFSKQVMLKAEVPTANCEIFEDAAQAKDYIKDKALPLVIKADGLAQGKGVIIAKTQKEAEDAIYSMLESKLFGEAGARIMIEECLVGEEASILVFCDGKDIVPLASSQDHKRIFDNDQGLNTGGMGAYSPAPIITSKLMKQIMKKIIRPIVDEMNKIGCPYKGVLYAGIMLTEEGPKVLEFNARFGDPETEVILPRLNSDLVSVMLAVVEERLAEIRLSWKRDSCVCVVLSSKGYPGSYEKGKEITGLDSFKGVKNVVVFHSGTKSDNGKFFTDGGRVLGVTALGKTIEMAITNAYAAVEKIKFEGIYYRKDIGRRALGK